MDSLVINASPWLCAFLACLYWWVFIEAEILRHYEPTGKRWPKLRERKDIVLVKPKRTHFYGWTAVLLTLTFVVMIIRPRDGWTGLIVFLLIIYLFVALWCGPMCQLVPTYEGIGQMAASVNFMLYLCVHKWFPAAAVLEYMTFGIVLGAIFFGLLHKRLTRASQQQS